MIELFGTLNEYLWISDFAVMCVFALVAFKFRQNSSTLITLAIAAILSGVIIKYGDLVNSFKDPASAQSIFLFWCIGFGLIDCVMTYVLYRHYKTFKSRYKTVSKFIFIIPATAFLAYTVYLQYGPLLFDIKGPSYKVWRLAAFYLGVALLDGLVIYVIHQAHQLSNKPRSFIARTYILAFFVAANLQIISFIELYFWQTNKLANVYQWSLASINICTTLVAMVIACLAIYQHYNNKQPREGILWKF
jgi:hypothetical protein